MTAQLTTQNSQTLRQEVTGSRRFSNFFWAVVVSGGSTGFLLSGLSSYLQVNLLPFSNPTELQFIPQGIAMGFYGVAGLLLALYLWLVITWNVGGGYNNFDKEKNELTIFRWGYPGGNRQIELNCPLNEVQSVRAEIKEGLNPTRAIYLKVKGRRDIPLTRVGQPISLAELENESARLARFLQVPLEGL